MSDRPSRNRSNSGDYRPAQPSALRHSHRPRSINPGAEADSNLDLAPSTQPASSSAARMNPGGFLDETTPLVTSHQDRRPTAHPAHGGICTHGTFSPRPETPIDNPIRASSSDGSTTPGSGTRIPALDNAITAVVGHDGWKKWLKKQMRTKKMGQSNELAEAAGIRDTHLMLVNPYT